MVMLGLGVCVLSRNLLVSALSLLPPWVGVSDIPLLLVIKSQGTMVNLSPLARSDVSASVSGVLDRFTIHLFVTSDTLLLWLLSFMSLLLLWLVCIISSLFQVCFALCINYIIPRNDRNSFLHLGSSMSISAFNFLGYGLEPSQCTISPKNGTLVHMKCHLTLLSLRLAFLHVFSTLSTVSWWSLPNSSKPSIKKSLAMLNILAVHGTAHIHNQWMPSQMVALCIYTCQMNKKK